MNKLELEKILGKCQSTSPHSKEFLSIEAIPESPPQPVTVTKIPKPMRKEY